MSVILQDKVFADANFVNSDLMRPFVAHISGPHAKLFRYANSDEKSLASLDAYDADTDTVYDWPNQPTGSKIDLDYTKIFFDNALLMYFSDLINSASTIAPVAGYSDRVRSDSVAFKENGDDYPRSSLLYDRDVAVDDVVDIRGTAAGESYSLRTYVKGFVGEEIVSTVDAAESESTNKDAQGASVSVDKIGGPDNCITPVADIVAYDGLLDGDIEETYTVEVLTGSSGGDFSTATLKVTSESGNDDVDSVTPQSGGDVDIGTRGLRLSFQLTPGASCTSAADVDDVSETELVVGQKWRVHVFQQFTPPTPTSSGTFTGDFDATYIVEVTKGGLFGDEPEITCTTDTGIDSSGPTAVTGSFSAVAVGSNGVFISFQGDGLCKGDRYLITVTKEEEGSMQTLVLGHNLPDELLDAADLDLKLYIEKSGLEITENRVESPPDVNWEADDDGITLKAGITAYDSSWTDDDEELPLEIVEADAYVEYRAWITDYNSKIGELSDVDLVEATLGAVTPDNPLSYAVHLALLNGNSRTVKFTSVLDPDDVELWSAVLDRVEFREEIYALVPLTYNEEILDLFAEHAIEQSESAAGAYRVVFINLQASDSGAVASKSVNSTDDETILATLSDNPDETGTQYTYLTVTSDNVSLISTAGVEAGDIVRYLYSIDGFGTETYTEFVVEEVVNESTVVLSTGHAVAVPTPQRVEFWRNYSSAEIVAQLKETAEAYGSTRVRAVWPDQLETADFGAVAGYFGCAALAGLRTSASPHRSLRDVELFGFTDASRTEELLTSSQIRQLGEGRVWVIGVDRDDNIISKYAVTTDDPTNINKREEAVITDSDAISFAIFAEMRPFFSKSNVHTNSLSRARTQLNAVLEMLKSSGQTDDLGPMLIDGEITELRFSIVDNSRLAATIECDLPFPFSKDMELVLTI